jgi:hypothetical protein
MKWTAKDPKAWMRWHIIFAWLPRRARTILGSEHQGFENMVVWKWVWLERVERRGIFNGNLSWWEYRK